MPMLTLRGSSTARYGTLQEPLPWNVPVGGALRPEQGEISFLLSYDTLPSTNVISVQFERRVVFRVDRISDDKLACNVGVALLDHQRQRIGTLVSSADGKGQTYELKPGKYLIVASNFIPETIDITLRAAVSMAYVELRGAGQSDQSQYADGLGTSFPVATMHQPLQEGVADLAAGAAATRGTLLGRDDGDSDSSNDSAWLAPVGLASVDTGQSEALLTLLDDLVVLNPGGGSGGAGGGSGNDETAAGGSANGSMARIDASDALRAPFEWVDDYGVTIRGVPPLDYDLNIHRRADFELLVSLRNPDDSPLSLTGLTIEVQLWDLFGSTKYADLTILPSPGPGMIYALLEDTQTLALPDVVYMRTLLTDGEGNVAYPLRGRWTIIEGYTA